MKHIVLVLTTIAILTRGKATFETNNMVVIQ